MEPETGLEPGTGLEPEIGMKAEMEMGTGIDAVRQTMSSCQAGMQTGAPQHQAVEFQARILRLDRARSGHAANSANYAISANSANAASFLFGGNQ